jgi:guanine deaminase
VNIIRGSIFHTPRNAFHHADALVSYEDGALVIDQGRIVDCGDYAGIAPLHPNVAVRDLRPGFILPGFIDTHIHYPQTRIIGSLGLDLLDWLEQFALPEEARFIDDTYAATVAREFVSALAAHGTTTALVFGSHFAHAVACLLNEAQQHGLRIFSGLVMADRNLRPDLQQTPKAAYDTARTLIAQFPNYVITPRFALSCSEEMLETCGILLREHPGLLFTTHINENPREIAEVLRQFPQATDYLDAYETFDLIGRDSVLAHNVHTSDAELARLCDAGAAIAHCPSSNAALGSGIFPMRRHLRANVRFALGSDVGAGVGFSLMREAVQSHLLQRVAPDPLTLTPAQMLYLATRAGAEALNLENETGDFTPGKSADFVHIRGSFHTLAALFTRADQTGIQEVRVKDNAVYTRAN